MSNLYGDSHRDLQAQFDTTRLADRIEQRLSRDALTDDDRAFIERLDMFFLATVDSRGQPTCSYKGGDPGFVRALDAHTLAFPNYDGNGMFLSMGNLAAHPEVGLLFIDFRSPKRLRVHGRARIEPSGAVYPPFPGAQFVVKVDVERAFPNCPRYIHRAEALERSKFVPIEGVAAPVPAWKQMDWARDVLPAGDPAAAAPPPAGKS
jgi:predicted pyridoxine 5'-phosphate oxidase superfamily flavin-nucleotide-binding protein